MKSARQNQTSLFEVPENHLFITGDNRDNSMDSRVPQSPGGPGFVPMENLTGRADLILVWLDGQPRRLFRTLR
ncbi:S26 family signal peptidase [Actibacterium sp. 188UL27-1]|uniref:S26 family signal peptidase n=1 Tax=Actibacterium sp. 188UL27-1 TaxID=2786961 RepID=UPI001959F115|nr:hypothetical protein [Actibacterium sp. 188UL27-1]